MKTALATILAAFLSLIAARADGLIVVRQPTSIPHGHRFAFAPLEVVFHHVDVDIAGQRATTKVEQEFYNPNPARLEGDYIFPIPKGAHLDRFTMRVGDKEMDAELLDADKARKIYEDIVRQQRDPALLEYTGRPAFRVRIFPIEPNERKKISLSYTELLKVDSGLASYLYPLNTEKFSAQPLKTASITVKVAADSPLKALYSPSHPVTIRREGERRAEAVWKTTNARPDTDFQLLFSTAETELGISLLTHRDGDDNGWFLLLASPGAAAKDGAAAQPKDVVFVLDTSGSMAGQKLEQAKKALTFCVENLNDGDRFDVVRFASDTETIFDRLTDATRAKRDQARKFVEQLRPTGGTAIADALARALKLRETKSERPFVVVFLTDGQPTVGERNEDRIVSGVTTERTSNTRIFCFGIGTDVNAHLLDKIAEQTKAASQYVLPEEDLEIKVSSFFAKIRDPLLTNLRLDFPADVKVTALNPSPLPDLFRGDQLVLTGRFSGSGEGDVTLEGKAGSETKRMTQRVKFGPGENPFIAQLWATRRIGWLLDEIRLRGENKELRDEVVELARKFAIVTPYTSYLIVEDEARRNVPLSAQTLPRLQESTATKSALSDNWRDYSKDKDGYTGTLNSRSNDEMKKADLAIAPQSPYVRGQASPAAPAAASAARAVAAKSRAGADVGDVARQLQDTQQAAQIVNGKSFTQSGTNWQDTAVQFAATNAKRTRVQFSSDEYFDLLAKRPESAQWLALGRNVTFTHAGEIFEVFE